MEAKSIGAIAGKADIGFREFVALIAALMALNALAIDSMLPALPEIGRALDILHDNDRQWIITAYLLGFGVAQLFWGILSDRFGRRPVLIGCLVAYALFSAMAAFAGSFALMIVARVLQGIAAAASRVLTISIVRDRYAGRQMARVMSLSFIVFLAVPIVAPTIGQLVLFVAPWRWIFGILAIYGIVMLSWTFLRLPETLHAEYRLPVTADRISGALRLILTDRMSVGYTAAMTLIFGTLTGFITSAQQLFYNVFKLPDLFPLIFAMLAGSMGISSFINSRVVGRHGMRRVSHSAMILYVAITGTHAAVAISGAETVWTFSLLQALAMGVFGMIGSNFGAIAMTSLGPVAGTAASVQGFVSTVGGALAGFVIGQQFDGTSTPLVTGTFVLGCLSLLAVFITEKGRLFEAHEQPVH